MADEQQAQQVQGGENAGVQPDVQPGAATPTPESQNAEQLASDFNKGELQTAAEVQGVDLNSRDTKADIAEKLVAAGPGRGPVHMDNYARRSDDDALAGSRVKILAGEHAGVEGAFHSVVSHGPDGIPELVNVKVFDTTYSHEFVTEPYSNLRTVRLDLVL